MHSKQKGAIGVAVIASDILRQGHNVFTEMGDLSKSDIIVLVNDIIPIKLQVKSMTSKNGAVILYRRSCGPNYYYKYNSSMVDAFAIYVLDTGDIGYLLESELHNGSQTFRITPAKNNQKALLKNISDYREFSRILRGHTRDTLMG
jgi:hypothetical protein